MNVATNSAACDIASSRLDVAADVSTRNVPGRDVYVSLHGTAYIDSITRVNVQLSDVSFNADSNLLPSGFTSFPSTKTRLFETLTFIPEYETPLIVTRAAIKTSSAPGRTCTCNNPVKSRMLFY
jgi:hypothetical protein